MLKKIYNYFLGKKLLKEYYNQRAEEVMKEYLQEDKHCVGVYDKKGNIKKIQKLEVISK